METIAFEKSGSVGWVRLDRPDKLNAMTPQLWRELAELGGELKADSDLRALVVIGNGRAFSSGIDLATFTGDGGGLGGDSIEDGVARTQEAFIWLQEAPFPTIAAIRGFALGAGLQLALACDLRVAVPGTRFGILETRYGLMPDLTGTQLLPRVVGVAKAKELVFTGEQIDTDEAMRIGLVNRVVDDADLESAATALAERLAAQPPIALRWSKQAIDASTHLPLREGLKYEQQGQAECIRSSDFREAITAFMEKRPAAFTGS